jgi:hypothetical protein
MNWQEFSMIESTEAVPQSILSEATFSGYTAATPAQDVSAARLRALRGRRRITREQGRALETIGHAADYLMDSYVHIGPAAAILHPNAAELEAVQLLIQARNRVLESLERSSRSRNASPPRCAGVARQRFSPWA